MTTETLATDTTINGILDDAGVTYAVLHVGKTTRDGWECDAWRVTFTRDAPSAVESFDYFTGLGHRSPAPKPYDGGPAPRRNTLMWESLEKQRKPIAPSATSVLSCLILDADASDQSFAGWASGFGYDPDSRKALALYLACQQTAAQLRSLFGVHLQALQEALADY